MKIKKILNEDEKKEWKKAWDNQDRKKLLQILKEKEKRECGHESHFISSMNRCEKCDK